MCRHFFLFTISELTLSMRGRKEGQGDDEVPLAYSPVSLVGTAEKLLDKFIKPRLTDAIRAAEV